MIARQMLPAGQDGNRPLNARVSLAGATRDTALAGRAGTGAQWESDARRVSASDADRDRVVDVLHVAAGEGRNPADPRSTPLHSVPAAS